MFASYQVSRFLRFCTVGVGNTVVDFAAFLLLTLAGVPYLLAQVLSYSAGVANSFFFNRKWTFGLQGKTNIMEIARFAAVNGLSLLASSGLLFLLHDLGHSGLWLSKIAATAVSITVN